MKRFAKYYQLVAAVVFGLLFVLTLQGQALGMVGLGTLLIVLSMWSVFRAKRIWKDYRAKYRSRKTADKSIWTEPKELYFYLHLFLVVPLMLGTGLVLLWLAAYIQSQV